MPIPIVQRVTAGAIAAVDRLRPPARSPLAPGVPAVRVPPRSVALPMSEWLVVGGLALALIWSRFAWVLPFDIPNQVEHLPGMIVTAGLALTFFGGALRPRRASVSLAAPTPLRMLWPLMLLAAWVLVGSLYAQLALDITTTFRSLGVYMLFALLIAHVVARSLATVRLVTWYFVVLAVAGVVSVVVAGVLFATSGRAAFHELEFLVIPLVVYVATLRPQMRLRDTVLVWSGIASIVLFSKNTGYLTALVVVAYLWWMHWRVTTHRAIAVRRTLQWLLGAALLAGAVGAYTYLRSTQSAAIPSGNTEFRVHMYGLAWQRFLDSPLWGQAYAASAVQRFTLYEIRRPGNILPTHSDLLDILSHGGLLGIGLWLAAHVKLLGNTWRQVLARRGELAPHVVAMAHTFTCMVLAGVVTYAFNPLLLDPTRALVVWGQFGLLAGLTCSLAAARHAGLARDPAEP